MTIIGAKVTRDHRFIEIEVAVQEVLKISLCLTYEEAGLLADELIAGRRKLEATT